MGKVPGQPDRSWALYRKGNFQGGSVSSDSCCRADAPRSHNIDEQTNHGCIEQQMKQGEGVNAGRPAPDQVVGITVPTQDGSEDAEDSRKRQQGFAKTPMASPS